MRQKYNIYLKVHLERDLLKTKLNQSLNKMKIL